MAFWNEYNEVTGITYEDPPWVTAFIQSQFGGAGGNAPQERQAFNPETGNIEFQRWNQQTKSWDWTGIIASRPPPESVTNPNANDRWTGNGPQGYGTYILNAEGQPGQYIGNPQAPASTSVSVSLPPSSTGALTKEEATASITADGGQVVNRGGVIIGIFPDGSQVKYDPQTVRGETRYNPTYVPPPAASAAAAKVSPALAASEQYRKTADNYAGKGQPPAGAGPPAPTTPRPGSSPGPRDGNTYRTAAGSYIPDPGEPLPGMSPQGPESPGVKGWDQPSYGYGNEAGTLVPKVVNEVQPGGGGTMSWQATPHEIQNRLGPFGLKASGNLQQDLAAYYGGLAERSRLMAPGGLAENDPLMANEIFKVVGGPQSGANERLDASGRNMGSGRGYKGLYGADKAMDPNITLEELAAIVTPRADVDYMAEGGMGFTGMGAINNPTGERRREWPADPFSRYSGDQTLPGPLDYANNQRNDLQRGGYAGPLYMQYLNDPRAGGMTFVEWKARQGRSQNEPFAWDPSLSQVPPAPGRTGVSMYAGGGQFATRGPLAMVDMQTGQTEAVAGESGPEAVSVQPLQSPYGGLRGRELAATRLMAPRNPLLPTAFAQLIESLLMGRRKGRTPPLRPVGAAA